MSSSQRPEGYPPKYRSSGKKLETLPSPTPQSSYSQQGMTSQRPEHPLPRELLFESHVLPSSSFLATSKYPLLQSTHPKKRQRFPPACSVCRHKKIKCNKQQPCESCTENGTENLCHYDELPWVSSVIKEQTMSQRIQDLENDNMKLRQVLQEKEYFIKKLQSDRISQAPEKFESSSKRHIYTNHTDKDTQTFQVKTKTKVLLNKMNCFIDTPQEKIYHGPASWQAYLTSDRALEPLLPLIRSSRSSQTNEIQKKSNSSLEDLLLTHPLSKDCFGASSSVRKASHVNEFLRNLQQILPTYDAISERLLCFGKHFVGLFPFLEDYPLQKRFRSIFIPASDPTSGFMDHRPHITSSPFLFFLPSSVEPTTEKGSTEKVSNAGMGITQESDFCELALLLVILKTTIECDQQSMPTDTTGPHLKRSSNEPRLPVTAAFFYEFEWKEETAILLSNSAITCLQYARAFQNPTLSSVHCLIILRYLNHRGLSVDSLAQPQYTSHTLMNLIIHMSGKLALHRNPLALQRVYSEYPLTNSVDSKSLREIRTRNRPETWLSVVNLNITHYLGVGYTSATFQADDHVYRVPQTWIKEHNTLVMNIIKELSNNPQETTISSLETSLHLLVDYLDQDKAIIATSQIFGHPEMSPVEKARKLQMRMQLYEVILMCYNMLVISINGEGSGAHMPHGEERERLYRYYGLKCVKYALCSLAIYRQFSEFLRSSGEPKHAIRCFSTIQLESLVPRALLTLISYLVRSTWTDQSSLQRSWRKDVFTSFTLDRLENGSEHDEPSLKASSEPLESLLADRGCLLEYGKMIVQRCQDAEEPCLIQISWAVPVFQALELRLELFMQSLEEQRRQTSHLNGTFTAAERVPGITLQGLQDDNLPQSYSPRAFSSTQVKMKESLPAFQAQPTQSSLIGRPSSGYYPTVYFPHSEGVPIHFQRATIEQAYPPARELQQTIYHPFGTYSPHINPHAISQAPTPFDPSFILPNQYMPYYSSYTAQSSQQADFHVFTQPPPSYSNPTSQRPNTEAFFGDPRNAPNQQNRWDV